MKYRNEVRALIVRIHSHEIFDAEFAEFLGNHDDSSELSVLLAETLCFVLATRAHAMISTIMVDRMISLLVCTL